MNTSKDIQEMIEKVKQEALLCQDNLDCFVESKKAEKKKKKPYKKKENQEIL